MSDFHMIIQKILQAGLRKICVIYIYLSSGCLQAKVFQIPFEVIVVRKQ